MHRVIPLIGDTYIVPKIGDGVSKEDVEEIFGIEDPMHQTCTGPEFMKVDIPDDSPLLRLELPRRGLPENFDMSKAVVLIGESRQLARVFVFDSVDGSLYHVFDKKRNKDQDDFQSGNGYAAIDGRVYFIGGWFCNHDREYCYWEAFHDLGYTDPAFDSNNVDESLLAAKIDEMIVQNLEVDCVDLKTGNVDFVGNLNYPKPSPTVFAYRNKVYAIECHSSDRGFHHQYGTFECLDLSDTELTWTKLQVPERPWAPYMLDTCKGILLVITDSEESNWKGQLIESESEGRLIEFDLASQKWGKHSPVPNFYFDSISDITGHLPDLLNGCTVGDFLFCYNKDRATFVPSIVVYDVSKKGDEHVVNCTVDLSDALKGHDDLHAYRGFLNHLGGLKFCLVILYIIQTTPSTKAVCIMTFQLQNSKTTQINVTPNQPKQPKVEKSSFILGPCHCRMFQLPVGVKFSFCKKMITMNDYGSEQPKPSAN